MFLSPRVVTAFRSSWSSFVWVHFYNKIKCVEFKRRVNFPPKNIPSAPELDNSTLQHSAFEDVEDSVYENMFSV